MKHHIETMTSFIVSAFSFTSTQQGSSFVSCQQSAVRCRQKESITSRLFASSSSSSPTDNGVVNTSIPVSRVSVCTGELCQCQGEQYEYTGGAAFAIIEELQSIGLPFPVDEVGCMGACGMGTMVAIDYENGDSIMTDGLESTLVELGIQLQHPQKTAEPARAIHGPAEADVTPSDSRNRIKSIIEPEKTSLLADVRDRMRMESEEATEVGNPWMKMASYLAEKAMDKLIPKS